MAAKKKVAKATPPKITTKCLDALRAFDLQSDLFRDAQDTLEATKAKHPFVVSLVKKASKALASKEKAMIKAALACGCKR